MFESKYADSMYSYVTIGTLLGLVIHKSLNAFILPLTSPDGKCLATSTVVDKCEAK